MKVVLLAGGYGTRITEISEHMPKPMIEIGGMPIIWHIMKEYSHYGFNDFIICAGYKQHMIKEWFSNYFYYTSDITFDFTDGNKVEVHDPNSDPWRVTVANTGEGTMTGGRIKRVQKYIGNETFMMTYGDGVCDVDLRKLYDYHKSHGKIATLTTVSLKQNKGLVELEGENVVRSFREKTASSLINAGYMVLEPAVLDYIEGDSVSFEDYPMTKLSEEGELISYRHDGFWQCMDTLYEKNLLEKLYMKKQAPWVSWDC